MGYIFVVTHHRISELGTRGSVTGSPYVIGRHGGWVDERDWPEMQTLEKHICCPAAVVRAFWPGLPSSIDMKRKPLEPVVLPAAKKPRRRKRKPKVIVAVEDIPTTKDSTEEK